MSSVFLLSPRQRPPALWGSHVRPGSRRPARSGGSLQGTAGRTVPAPRRLLASILPALSFASQKNTVFVSHEKNWQEIKS